MEFGELKDLDLRTAWPDEASDFTPWLANNLERLSQVIGIQLVLEDIEVPVDGFTADIMAVTADGNRVVIENQFGRTDHDHLGKAITYTSGLEAQTVVWIAERFHEAHLAAVRWLNENTGEQFSFLGIQLKVVQIGDSPMVPVFEIVVQPEAWHEHTAHIIRSDRLSDVGQFRKDFWEYYARRYPSDIPRISATSNQWVYVAAADLNISLALVRDKVGLFLRGNRREGSGVVRKRIQSYETAFRGRYEHWPEDEPIYDCAEWMRIRTHDRNNWPEMADWLHEQMEIYQNILTGQIGQITNGSTE